MAEALKFVALMKNNRAGLWTTLGGGFLIFVVWQLSIMWVSLHAPALVRVLNPSAAASGAAVEGVAIFISLVGGYGPALLVLFAWRRLMEQRGIVSLFSATRTIRWGMMVASFWVIAVWGLVLTALFTPDDLDVILVRLTQFSAVEWAMLALFYGLGIAIQAGFEEVFVRGWLLQHVYRFVPNAIGAIVVTALIFTTLHIGHPGWATYVAAIAFGLAFGWSVIRLNGLEAALGAHIANNLVGGLLAGQMLTGNAATMDGSDFALYSAYVLGFLAFVEVWVRFFPNPSRA